MYGAWWCDLLPSFLRPSFGAAFGAACSLPKIAARRPWAVVLGYTEAVAHDASSKRPRTGADEALYAAPALNVFAITGFENPYKDAVKGRKLDSNQFPTRNKLAACKALAASRLAGLLQHAGQSPITHRKLVPASVLETLCNLQQ